MRHPRRDAGTEEGRDGGDGRGSDAAGCGSPAVIGGQSTPAGERGGRAAVVQSAGWAVMEHVLLSDSLIMRSRDCPDGKRMATVASAGRRSAAPGGTGPVEERGRMAAGRCGAQRSKVSRSAGAPPPLPGLLRSLTEPRQGGADIRLAASPGADFGVWRGFPGLTTAAGGWGFRGRKAVSRACPGVRGSCGAGAPPEGEAAKQSRTAERLAGLATEAGQPLDDGGIGEGGHRGATWGRSLRRRTAVLLLRAEAHTAPWFWLVAGGSGTRPGATYQGVGENKGTCSLTQAACVDDI